MFIKPPVSIELVTSKYLGKTMKNTNEIKLSAREHAEKLLAQIIKSRKMLDMYEFVHNECWRDLSFDSLQECVDEYDCPSYSTFRRNYNAAVYQCIFWPNLNTHSDPS